MSIIKSGIKGCATRQNSCSWRNYIVAPSTWRNTLARTLIPGASSASGRLPLSTRGCATYTRRLIHPSCTRRPCGWCRVRPDRPNSNLAPGLHLSTTAVSCVCPLSFTRGSHPSTSAACVPFNACSTFAPSALRKGPAPRVFRCSNTSSSQLATPAESSTSQYDWRRHWFPVYFVK